MEYIIQGFGQFLAGIFMLSVVGIIWDKVISAFRGWL